MPIFSVGEIFEMAEQIERNGVRFYKTAASYATKGKSQQVFEKLAAMEQQHEKTFADMRVRLTGLARQQTTFDPEGEAGLYLKAFVDGKIFDVNADPSDRITGNEKPQEVLTTAIGLEKDSIVFYLGIEEMVPPSLGAGKIGQIIKEEMSHIRILGDLMAGLA